MIRAALALICLLCAPAYALDNQLRNHPSPYLALHGTDPTAWQEWNAETIARAKRENKLLFVSIGYFSCHWCHVMQRESYKNPDIAKLINERFIPVKVDRELNGALDSEMQAFAEATRGQAGWPLNVFITPDGYPLVALLYAPPQEFLQLLQRLDARWQQDADKLKQSARAAAQEIPAPQEAEARFAPQLAELYRQRLVAEALEQADTLQGGFGKVSKFPHSPQFAALLDAGADPRLAEFLKLTLDQMMNLGLRDHIGGGFFRYTVDPDWHTPHFEKMLYDNAQLARVYLLAAKRFNQPAYRAVAFETLDFMREVMWDAQAGAFLTSTSAIDSQDREGGVYLWSKEELQRLLNADDYALLVRTWRLDLAPELELGYLPVNKTMPRSEDVPRLQAIYAKLKTVRNQRPLPKDDKLLTGLNGLALSALSDAAQLDDKYRPLARSVRDFLARQVSAEGLRKGTAKGVPLGHADLEDYAYAAEGLWRYAKLTHGPEDEALARDLVTAAWNRFHTARGWQLEQKPLLARPYTQLIVGDSPTPAPSSVLIRLSWEMGGKTLRTHALKALNVGYPILDQGVFWYATQVNAMAAIR